MKKIKLNNLSVRKMSEKQMDVVNGGEGYEDYCGCSCYYRNQGGASTTDNFYANNFRGIPKSIRGNTRMEDLSNQTCVNRDEVIIKP